MPASPIILPLLCLLTSVAVAESYTSLKPFAFPADKTYGDFHVGDWGNGSTIKTWPNLSADKNAPLIMQIFPALIESKKADNSANEAAWGKNGVLVPDLCGQIVMTPRNKLAEGKKPDDTRGAPFWAATEQLIVHDGGAPAVSSWASKYDANTERFYHDIDPNAVAVNILFADLDGALYQTGNLTYGASC